MLRPLSRLVHRFLAKHQHQANGLESGPGRPALVKEPGDVATARRRLLLVFGPPAAVFILVLFLAGITAPELSTRRAKLARALAASRPQTDAQKTFASFYRDAFTERPHTTDPPFVTLDIIEPQDPSGLGAGWTFVMIHALAEVHAESAYQWREGLMNTGGVTGPRWIIPQAAEREQPTIPAKEGVHKFGPNGGAVVPAWFGIHNWTDMHRGEDEHGYQESTRMIAQTIRKEIIDKGVPMSRVIIGGFSQGSVMSILLTLTLPEPPAGVFVISGYLPLPRLLYSLAPPSRSLPNTRLAWLHGLGDPYLTAANGEAGYKLLTETVKFKDARWRAIPNVGHGWDREGAEIMFAWIKGMVKGE